MGYKALAAAAVMAISVSQVEAAVVKYDIDLRYVGTTFRDVLIYVNNPAGDVFVIDQMGLEGNPFGITGMHSGLTYGQTVKFTAEVHYADDPNDMIGQFDNGTRAYGCYLANASCNHITYGQQRENNFGLYYDDSIAFDGSLEIGGTISHSFWRPWKDEQYAWGRFWTEWETAEFEVISVNEPQPAPVPLPATAALLPLGLAALAAIRKRRKAA